MKTFYKKIFFSFLLFPFFVFSQTIAAGGGNHSLAVCNDNTVMAWGNNSYGELGNGITSASNVPVQVNSLTGITAVAGGEFHSLALKNDSTIWAWGACKSSA